MTDVIVADHRAAPVQLAIETTGRHGSLAILRGNLVLESINLPKTTRTAATLAVHLDQILAQHRSGTRRLDLISIADGPGSFTGLRIGVTTAKSLGYALKIPLVSVDSLAAIAATTFQDHPEAVSVCVGLDAYRGQIYSGCFHRQELLPPQNQLSPLWTPHPPQTQVLDSQGWSRHLSKIGQGEKRLTENVIPMPRNWLNTGDERPFREAGLDWLERSCDAIGVGLLGWRAYQLGQTIDPLKLMPRYLKPSAAEEQANQQI
ncbi:tRNA (adenosine(37)-N6)-threonylcarbamoyltransferase complex dimerization subunit type 1 TsaB [bacterium]|nr:tRNA (adenosine(37)-N6)-threonylcarbamoyltransferase complex dimerization subunit type 1 TsaB [Rubripirellula sp.]MDB4338848.1 tRNA (adenosine(37)-N6)-threonylcarbamoyltransferase complex dimerization subunit type 1 TsaB [Rubripirellula sp.]MDC0278843.1 tRNA (adenosine(37)-N6)-threonylcarbamoyltransferase complex dimerization subunit type 1 TsaB [bacterium]